MPMDDFHDEDVVDTDKGEDENEGKLFYDEVVRDDYDLLLMDSVLKEVFNS